MRLVAHRMYPFPWAYWPPGVPLYRMTGCLHVGIYRPERRP